MIQLEVTGTKTEPNPADVLRSGAEQKQGRCELKSGKIVFAL